MWLHAMVKRQDVFKNHIFWGWRDGPAGTVVIVCNAGALALRWEMETRESVEVCRLANLAFSVVEGVD